MTLFIQGGRRGGKSLLLERERKLENIRQTMMEHDLYFLELEYGNFIVDGITLIGNLEIWYCEVTQTHGRGLDKMIEHLKERESNDNRF